MVKRYITVTLCLSALVATLPGTWSCAAESQKQLPVSSINSSDTGTGLNTVPVTKRDKSIFALSYTCVGMGSSFCSMQPVFKVDGRKFIYTSEQTSFYEGQEIQKPITICSGELRTSSIDSIIDLVDDIKDSVVYRNNTHIMSGSVQYIFVSKNDINLEFTLHNASDPTAVKIIDILNKYIPATEEKLWLSDIPEDPK